jgi:hypothetical protein
MMTASLPLEGASKMRAEINNCSKIEISGYLEGSVMAVEVIVREGAYLKGHIPNSQCP